MSWPRFNEREVLGFLLAPLPLLTPMLLLFGTSAIFGDEEALRFFAEFLFMGYGPILLIGVPVHLLLRSRKRTDLTPYLLLTTLGCALTCLALAVFDFLYPPTLLEDPFGMRMWGPFGIKVTIAFIAVGWLGAWIFWRIAVRPPLPSDSRSDPRQTIRRVR